MKIVRQYQNRSATFQSTTSRSLDAQLRELQKKQQPGVGHYGVERDMAAFQITGGAPNNFLLMRNEKVQAPFSTTVKRFQGDKTDNNQRKFCLLSEIGPGAYNHALDLTNSGKIQAKTKKTTFGVDERFSQFGRKKNWRIGPN